MPGRVLQPDSPQMTDIVDSSDSEGEPMMGQVPPAGADPSSDSEAESDQSVAGLLADAAVLEAEPFQALDPIAFAMAELTQLEAQVTQALATTRHEVEGLREELMTARAEAEAERHVSFGLETQLDQERNRVRELRFEIEYAEGQYREAVEDNGKLQTEVRALTHRVEILDRFADAREAIMHRQRQQLDQQTATIAELRMQLQADQQVATIAELRRQLQDREIHTDRGLRSLRRAYRDFEGHGYAPEPPYAPSSSASVPKRARLYEPLEGSGDGPTDPVRSDDGDDGGATSGASAPAPDAVQMEE